MSAAVTYTVSMTAKAHRFARDIATPLVASHRQFDPSLPPFLIRVITHILSNGEFSYFLNGAMQGPLSKRFIRVVIDVPAGRLEQRKRELMQRVTDACMEYEGKRHAGDCEVEVVVNEVQVDEDVLLTTPTYSSRRMASH